MTNTNYIEVHHNLETGEVTERPYTEDEIAATQSRIASREAEAQAEAQKAADKASAQAKLAALGLTQEEIAALSN